MRFSPDKRPQRPPSLKAGEIFEIAEPELEEYVFDPETDIPTEDLEALLASDSLEIITLLNTIVPHRISPATREQFTQNIQKVITPEEIGWLFEEANGQVDSLKMNILHASWFDPEFRTRFVDLTPPSLASRARRLLRSSKKIDLTSKQVVITNLERLFDPHLVYPTKYALNGMQFLINFFPDGRQIVEGIMKKKGLTEGELAQRKLNPDEAFAATLLFPRVRQELLKEPDFLPKLKQLVGYGGPEPKGIGNETRNYLYRVMTYAVLTAQQASLDHTGIHLVLGSKSKLSRPTPPLPGRQMSV